MHTSWHPNKLRQFFFVFLLSTLTLLIGKECLPVLSAFLGAITFYVLLRPLMHWLCHRIGWKRWIAALMLVLLSVSFLMIPGFWFMHVLSQKLQPFLQHPNLLINSYHAVHDFLFAHFHFNFLPPETLSGYELPAATLLQHSIGNTFSLLLNLFVLFILLYFLLTESPQWEPRFRAAIPLREKNIHLLFTEFKKLLISNSIGIPAVAITQGILGMVGCRIFGIEDVMLAGMLIAFSSLIPVVGSGLIYLPLAIYLFSQHKEAHGWGLLIWGTAIVGIVDNLIRISIQKRLAQVHPLITFFGLLVGLPLFGIFGIIFGPLMISLFFLLLRIYRNEFHESEE